MRAGRPPRRTGTVSGPTRSGSRYRRHRKRMARSSRRSSRFTWTRRIIRRSSDAANKNGPQMNADKRRFTFRRCSVTCGFVLLSLSAQELPVVQKVDAQPLGAQVIRVLDSLKRLGDPLPAGEDAELRGLAAGSGSVENIQKVLDRHCLLGVNINPESRVKVVEGPAKPELVEQGWRTFLVKVHNEAGVTAVLSAASPQAGQLANRGPEAVPRRFLDVQMYTKQPMRERLSGLELEYRILQLYAREAGKREAKLQFDIGQGSQDLGFRSEIDVLFTIRPATRVTLRVFDSDDQPTTASFLVRDALGRVYPSQAKRLAPDFFFQPQVYRGDKD